MSLSTLYIITSILENHHDCSILFIFSFVLVSEKLWFGDWFILMQICKNISPVIFHDLVIDLRDRYFRSTEL